MTETQQRFLRAIAERVSKEQVVEVHLFPAIRQGGVETGVAVVAERPRPSEAAALEAPTIDADAAIETDAAMEPAPISETDAIMENDVDFAIDAGFETDVVVESDAADALDTAPAHRARLIVHTARYRLTLKGVDRGKWEVDVVAEADAPLAAVDAVVRGVQRRAGEGAEPDRLTTEAFREALDAPLATLDR